MLTITRLINQILFDSFNDIHDKSCFLFFIIFLWFLKLKCRIIIWCRIIWCQIVANFGWCHCLIDAEFSFFVPNFRVNVVSPYIHFDHFNSYANKLTIKQFSNVNKWTRILINLKNILWPWWIISTSVRHGRSLGFRQNRIKPRQFFRLPIGFLH